MSIKQDTVKGIGWSTIDRITSQVLRLLTFAILSRFISPEEYGQMAMVAVFTGFADVFCDLGLGASLIQRNEVQERHCSSIFWINAALGLTVAAVSVCSTRIVADFYAKPVLAPLLAVVSMNFIISSLTTVQSALLTKQMDFRSLAICNLLSMIISSLVAVVLAYRNFGVWALAWQGVVATLSRSVLYWRSSTWRPKFIFDQNAVRDMMNFGSNLFGFNVINYWLRNGDNLLVGKFIGSAGLGIYNRAYNLMLLPLYQVSSTIGQVMFPALSKIQSDKAKVKEIYLRAISVIALVTFPMMLGLFVVADVFVLTMFGEKWTEVTPILRLFCLVGLVHSIGTTVGWIYMSQGRTDVQLRWAIAAGTLVMPSIVVGIILGKVFYVALCYSIMAGVIVTYHNFTIPGRLIGLSFSEVVKAVSPALICSLAMAVVVYSFGKYLPASIHYSIKLPLQVILGISFYAVTISYFKIESFLIVKEQLFHIVRVPVEEAEG